VEKRFGSFIKKWKARYLILNRDVLQFYAVNEEGGPDIYDMKTEVFLPELVHLEAVPNLGLNLSFEDESLLQLRFRDVADYQCWLSCFVVFHSDFLPFVPSTYVKGIWTAFEYIQTHSWKVEGIFRVPGLKCETVKLAKELLLAGTVGAEPVNLEGVHIHTLCSASKTLIDKLPATLLTEKLYDRFVTADKDDGLKLAELVHQLPPQNQAILQHVLFTLTKIADETEVTMMNAHNLGILFGTMFVSRTKSVQDYVLDIQDLQQLIASLITFYDIIFIESEPSYPLYVPKLQRDLLEAQKIDIRELLSQLTLRGMQNLLPNGTKIAQGGEDSDSCSINVTYQDSNTKDTTVSLVFIERRNEKKTAEMADGGRKTRPSQVRQGGSYPSRKLEQLFMTLRENAIPRDTEFAGSCCVLRRRQGQKRRDSRDMDRRRSRFSTYLDSSKPPFQN